MNENLGCPTIASFGDDILKCEKCNSIPDFTIFISKDKVKLFSECKNKHWNII